MTPRRSLHGKTPFCRILIVQALISCIGCIQLSARAAADPLPGGSVANDNGGRPPSSRYFTLKGVRANDNGDDPSRCFELLLKSVTPLPGAPPRASGSRLSRWVATVRASASDRFSLGAQGAKLERLEAMKVGTILRDSKVTQFADGSSRIEMTDRNEAELKKAFDLVLNANGSRLGRTPDQLRRWLAARNGGKPYPKVGGGDIRKTVLDLVRQSWIDYFRARENERFLVALWNRTPRQILRAAAGRTTGGAVSFLVAWWMTLKFGLATDLGAGGIVASMRKPINSAADWVWSQVGPDSDRKKVKSDLAHIATLTQDLRGLDFSKLPPEAAEQLWIEYHSRYATEFRDLNRLNHSPAITFSGPALPSSGGKDPKEIKQDAQAALDTAFKNYETALDNYSKPIDLTHDPQILRRAVDSAIKAYADALGNWEFVTLSQTSAPTSARSKDGTVNTMAGQEQANEATTNHVADVQLGLLSRMKYLGQESSTPFGDFTLAFIRRLTQNGPGVAASEDEGSVGPSPAAMMQAISSHPHQ